MLGGIPWSPQASGPVAWYYAAGQYVSLNGAVVVNWNDRLANGGDIIQVAPGFQPTWEPAGGWSASKASIFSASDTLNSPSGGLAPIESLFSGTSRPFSVLATCQIVLTGTQNICKWTGAGGVNQSCIITNSNFLSISRSDGVITETITDTTTPVGTDHIRVAYTFNGLTGAAYLGALRVLSGTVGLNVGPTTYTQFTLGDVRELRYTELIAIPRALSAAEVALYYAYSLNEWGA